MSCDMLASVWPKYLNLVHQTVSRACRYGLGTRLDTGHDHTSCTAVDLDFSNGLIKMQLHLIQMYLGTMPLMWCTLL